MPLLRALPRLLLCLLLVLDGIGGAMAAAHVHAPAAATAAQEAGSTGTIAMEDCDGHGAMPAAPGANAGTATVDTATTAGGHDCCGDAGAPCPCPGSHANAIAAQGPLHAAAGPATPAVHPLLAGHAAPRLPGPMRPPIA